MTARDEYLAGDRPDAVCLYLSDTVVSGDPSHLADVGERVADGVVLIVDGEQGRTLVSEAIGVDVMAFAREAMGTESPISEDLTGGTCPEDPGHAVSFIFSFVEPQHEDVEGPYAAGAVVHAYAACTCGESYSDRWSVE